MISDHRPVRKENLSLLNKNKNKVLLQKLFKKTSALNTDNTKYEPNPSVQSSDHSVPRMPILVILRQQYLPS
jgi:hypothetical protein